MTGPPTQTPPELREGHAFSEHGVIERYFRAPSRARVAKKRGGWLYRLRPDRDSGGKTSEPVDIPTMVDVGAYRGGSFKPFLDLGWNIEAFEPDPVNFESLVRLAAGPRVHIHRTAVSDEQCPAATWYINDSVDSISSLAPFDPSHRESSTVPVTTLTAALEKADVAAVQYLKVDAEGFDLQVLRGFPWNRLTPEVVLCEFEDRKTKPLGYGVHDLGTYLVKSGYEVYLSEWEPIEAYGGRHHWRRIARYPTDLWDDRAWGNFIGVLPQGSASMASAVLEEVLAERTKRVAQTEVLQDALAKIRTDLKTRNQEIATLKQETLSRMRADLRSRNQQIAELRKGVEHRQALLEELKQRLQERDAVIHQLHESLEDGNRTIAELRGIGEPHVEAESENASGKIRQ